MAKISASDHEELFGTWCYEGSNKEKVTVWEGGYAIPAETSDTAERRRIVTKRVIDRIKELCEAAGKARGEGR